MPNNKRANRQKQILHNTRLKAIRGYVNFDYDLRKPLTASAKRKIKNYYDEIAALTNRPFQVYRPRRADHLKEAQEFAQHEKRLPGLKVAFVPNDGQERLKIVYTKKGLKAKGTHVTISDVVLSKHKLLIDAVRHVNERIAGNGAKSYTIAAGRYEIPHGYTKDTIAQGVAKFVAKYNNPDDNSYFGNWLHGLRAYTFDKQDSLQGYLNEKSKIIKKRKRERTAEKKRKQRAAEKRSLGG